MFFPGFHGNKIPPEGVPFQEGHVTKIHEHVFFFTYAFGGQAFQRVSKIHIVDTPTLFCYKIAALIEKTPEAMRLVKILDEELEKRDDIHFILTKKLVVVVLVGALGLEFVLGFAPLESSISQLVLMFAPLGFHLVSAWVHDECIMVYLVFALVHLAIQTI
ncbi:hypothetical protein Tco_0200110 [Tanacetum coccineum]